LGRHIQVGGSLPLNLEIIGVASTARYGPLKYPIPPVVYVPYRQVPATQLQQMTYALRTDGDPLRYAGAIRQIVHEADARVPVTNIVTQAVEIDQTMNQEIVLAGLCTVFAVLALVIASVGLYGTVAYAVARRTGEIGIRMALGAGRGAVMWMVLREVCALLAVGLAISVPIARAASKFIESFLFDVRPNDPRTLLLAAVTLLTTALLAGYGPARRASRIDPTTALRHE
jgi:ABC-type antimicrobial peptide transport system permease subunit